MKKLTALLCLLTLPLIAQDAAKPASAASIEQYERAVPILIKQRSEADAQARDWQLQAALLSAEVEALKKQVADLSAKLATAEKKPAPVASASDKPQPKS